MSASLNQNGETGENLCEISLKRKECCVELSKRSRTDEETGSSQYSEAFRGL